MDKLFARSNWLSALVLAALFAALCFHEAASIVFPYVNLDEQGHVSYALNLAQSKEWFPSLTQMRLYDFEQMRWSGDPNFINHPPLAYHLLNMFSNLDPLGRGVRAASISFFALGFLAILYALHLTGKFSSLGLAAVTMFCVLLKLQRFGETFTNDSVAFLGGGLAFLGTVLLWRRPAPSAMIQAAFALGGIGLALCAAAKLNAAVLVSLFIVVSLAQFASRERDAAGRVSKLLIASLALLCVAAALPYASFLLKFGTPAPNTPGQIKMLSDSLDGPRIAFGAYLFQSVKGALGNAGPDAIATYAIFAAVTAFSALIALFRPDADADVLPLQPMARAVAAATALTLALHLAFSYQRHLQYGWQPELYPRYYFPLLGPYLLLFFSLLMKFGPLRAFAPKETG